MNLAWAIFALKESIMNNKQLEYGAFAYLAPSNCISILSIPHVSHHHGHLAH